MLPNKKGAALLQVLLVTVVLAGMATMLLRASLSRTTTSRKTRQMVSSQMLISTCQAEINALWSLKTPDEFSIDLSRCCMYHKKDSDTSSAFMSSSSTASEVATDSAGHSISIGGSGNYGSYGCRRFYVCKPVTVQGVTYQITATFSSDTPDTNGQCPLSYNVQLVNSGTLNYRDTLPTIPSDMSSYFHPYQYILDQQTYQRVQDAGFGQNSAGN